MDYKEKDVVWVKLASYPWWPAQVTDEQISSLYQYPKGSYVITRFFNEDTVEPITSNNKIKPFNCPEKDTYVTKGFSSKSEKERGLFIEALKMASIISDGTTCYLEKFLNMSQQSLVTKKSSSRKKNKMKSVNRTESKYNSAVNNIQNCDLQSKEKSNKSVQQYNMQTYSDSVTGNTNINQGNIHVKNELEDRTEQLEDLPKENVCHCGLNDTSPSHLCSNYTSPRHSNHSSPSHSNHSSASHSCSNHTSPSGSRFNYLSFKSDTLQKKVDWNTDQKEMKIYNVSNEERSNETDGRKNANVHINGAKTRDSKNKKRKLTFDENCNEEINQNLAKMVKKKSDSKSLSKTSTPKLHKQTNMKSDEGNINVIKTFTKLTQRNKEKGKSKRGRPQRSKTGFKTIESYTESETAMTPKCLKWDDSFELPTPDPVSQIPSCTAVLTATSFDPNLQKDTCDSSSDSDTELPEGLSPIVREVPVREKDIVWLKWRTFPAWPAFVRRVYRKKKRLHKLSLAYIDGYDVMPKRLTVAFKAKSIVPFVDKQKDQFIQEGQKIQDPDIRKKFTEACEKAENFLYKKALVSLNKEEFSFFGESDDEELDSDICDTDPPVNHTNISVTENRLSDFDFESDASVNSEYTCNSAESLTAKETERLKKMTAKQENLVNFIKSEEMKKYLFDIFYKRKKSERHQKYFHGTVKERDSLRYAGFGPIYNEEQEEEIIETTKKWLYDLPKKDVPDISYLLDVWIPEAVVYALIKVKGYGRKRAWMQFDKGISMTKAEKQRQHESMMEFVGYTEEEKKEVLEKAQQRMATFIYQHGLK